MNSLTSFNSDANKIDRSYLSYTSIAITVAEKPVSYYCTHKDKIKQDLDNPTTFLGFSSSAWSVVDAPSTSAGSVVAAVSVGVAVILNLPSDLRDFSIKTTCELSNTKWYTRDTLLS